MSDFELEPDEYQAFLAILDSDRRATQAQIDEVRKRLAMVGEWATDEEADAVFDTLMTEKASLFDSLAKD